MQEWLLRKTRFVIGAPKTGKAWQTGPRHLRATTPTDVCDFTDTETTGFRYAQNIRKIAGSTKIPLRSDTDEWGERYQAVIDCWAREARIGKGDRKIFVSKVRKAGFSDPFYLSLIHI